ncbi:MAG: hybrid sensor histidine kinase/response regulator, partial [Gammaproteobacteria bacterium]
TAAESADIPAQPDDTDSDSNNNIIIPPPIPHAISQELIDMLVSEAAQIEEEARQQAQSWSSETATPALREDALAQFALRIERLGSAAQAAELAGLHQACLVLHRNMELLGKQNSQPTAWCSNALLEWPQRVAAYLQQIDTTTAQQLVDILIADDWIEPLLPELQQPLLELLTAAYISTTDDREARLSQATPELVDITIPADINQELLDGLLQELPNQTEGFSAAVQALASGQGTQKDLEKAQRIAHTIKGAANTVGIRGAATLTHQIEDLLVMLVEHQRMPSQNLASTLVDAADCLEEICEALLERNQTPASAQPTLQAVLDWVNRLETDGISALDEDAPVSVATAETTAAANPAATAQEDTDEEQAQAATLRVPTSLIDNLLRLVGETLILTAQLQEKVNQSKEQNSALLNQHDIFQQLTSELEQQVDVRSVAMQSQNTNATAGFDSLEMEQYNELHTITHQLVEAAADSQELDQDIGGYLHSLDELLVSQSRLQREVQELVMHTRMVPIKTIVPRLQRAIRQTCRVTGKQAELVLQGTDTLIDSDILGSLVDPLMHMLRNAVDHGIETREQRISAGKPAVGSIHLQCLREGTQIVIRCEDDGAGLDTEAIMQTARKRGLLDGNQDVNEEFLQRLILQPGFSTRQATTQTSGRGIGMDVVATQLQQIKGSVLIHSKPGEGTRFELRLPMSLMTTHGLLIRVRKQVMAISARGIEQILHPDDGHEITEDGKQRYSLDEEILDYTSMDELLRLPKDRRTLDRSKQPALLIREETLNCVVQIEQVIDSRDLVVKPLGPYLRKVRGIVGATILGDGSVVPVLDLPELIRNPLQGNVEQMDMTDTSIRRSLPVALVVDDSISARRSLAQVVSDAGYEIRTAKDGLEAATLMEKKRPDILLTDLEMPRMNGIELTSHVRANPDMVDMPVIMITSRSTEKHRQSASSAGVDVYLTKPFTEDQLLQHVHDLLEKTYDTTA